MIKGTVNEKLKGLSDMYQILYKSFSIKQIIFNKYATNLKTTISQRSLRNSSLLLLLFEFDINDIINNIFYVTGTCHQNSNQLQCSIIVTRLRLYHILHCHWRELWSRDSDVYLTFWYNFDTVLCLFLESGTSDICLIPSTPEILRFHPIPPFIFPLQSL